MLIGFQASSTDFDASARWKRRPLQIWIFQFALGRIEITAKLASLPAVEWFFLTNRTHSHAPHCTE